MSTIVSDTYARTLTDDWGNATTGQAYTEIGVVADFDVALGVGTIQPSTTNTDRLAYLTADATSNHTVSAAVRWGTLPATGVLRAGVVPRLLDSANLYWGEIVVNTAGAITVRAQKRSGGTMSGLATFSHPTAYVAGAFWTVKAQIAGPRIQVKAWTGAVEPGWQVDFTDPAEAPTSGAGVGVYARNETTTPVVTHVASFDNLTVTVPTPAAILQSVYPPRVLLSLSDLNLADSVVLSRLVSGVRTPVRAGTTAGVTDTSFVVVDAELPFGVPVTYVATINGVDYTVGPTTYTLPGGKVVLSDAITGQSAEVTVSAWPSRALGRRSSQFRVGGRNVVVTGDLAGEQYSVELYINATSSVENVVALLEGATEGVIQVRQPGGYDGVDTFWSVVGVNVRRFSQDGTDPRRLISLDVIEVETWAPALEALSFTYADLEALYTGLTYQNLQVDFFTYLALAQADLS